MRYVRWVLLTLLLICFFRGSMQRPFFRELPMLLLPEQSSDVVVERSGYSAYDDMLDPRPICLQTKNNFSYFSQHNNREEDLIVSRLKSNLSINGANLLDDKIIATSRKDFSPEVTPVWATKRTLPIRISEQKTQKPMFIPKLQL